MTKKKAAKPTNTAPSDADQQPTPDIDPEDSAGDEFADKMTRDPADGRKANESLAGKAPDPTEHADHPSVLALIERMKVDARQPISHFTTAYQGNNTMQVTAWGGPDDMRIDVRSVNIVAKFHDQYPNPTEFSR